MFVMIPVCIEIELTNVHYVHYNSITLTLIR